MLKITASSPATAFFYKTGAELKIDRHKFTLTASSPATAFFYKTGAELKIDRHKFTLLTPKTPEMVRQIIKDAAVVPLNRTPVRRAASL